LKYNLHGNKVVTNHLIDSSFQMLGYFCRFSALGRSLMAPGRPAMFPSTHFLMPSVSKGAISTIFLLILNVAAGERTINIPYP